MLSAHFVFQLAEFALLSPLAGLAIRMLVSLSGSAVISDRDILDFALRPAGIATLVMAVSARIAVLALGQACLLGIDMSAGRGAPFGALSALAWSVKRALPILSV